MGIVKVTRKRQITLPKEVCDRLGIIPGDYVKVYVDEDDKAIVEKTLGIGELAASLNPEYSLKGGWLRSLIRRGSMGRGNKAFYDTNILLAYLFREENRFEDAEELIKKHLSKAISIISIHEIHMYSIKFNVEDKFIKVKDLLHSLFKIIFLNQSICIKASYIRRDYKLPEIDSLILATAIENKYTNFYTFDKDFEKLNKKRIEETTIHYLK